MGYFKYDSYNLLCNNCQNFAYWCLKIIWDTELFIPGSEIDFKKGFFFFFLLFYPLKKIKNI